MITRLDDGLARTLTFSHGKVNALDLEFCRALIGELALAEHDRVPALVLTGTGAIFGAGADLVRLAREGAPYVREFLPVMSDLFLDLFRFPAPVVAAINGHAIAGGAILAYAADWRVMTRNGGRIGVPELLVGVPFPLVPAEITRFALGSPRAEEAMFGAATLFADDARARGDVHEVAGAEETLPRAREVAARLAAVPRDAFRLTKLSSRTPVLSRIARERAGSDAETCRAWESDAVLGAIRAYVEKTLRR